MRPLPEISIGLPVFNGGKNLRNALNCLLSQDYPHYRIIVSDNDSSDDTAATINEYTSIDSRVEYHSCPHGGVPSTENFNRVLQLADGDFFMWASHNMLWNSSMLRQCVAAFEENPEAVLVSPKCNIVNGQTGRLMRVDPSIDTQRLDSVSRASRYLTSDLSNNTIFYGLMRRNIAHKIPLRIIFGTDHVFLAELSFTGEFVTIPKVLMTKHSGGTSKTWTSIADAERITSRWKRTFPWTAREYEMQKMLFFRAPINFRKQLLVAAISFLEYLKLTKSFKMLRALALDIEHHILPIVFRYPKPFGTATPIVLAKWLTRFGSISDQRPNKNK